MLVLTAVGIQSRLEPAAGGFRLLVLEQDFTRALAQLEQYQRENRGVGKRMISVPTIDRGSTGVIGFLLVIWLVPALEYYGFGGREWREAGVMIAGRVQEGEWWRTVTAMTLHGSLVHLISNSVFGMVFGLFLGRYLGSGLGWLLVIVAGAAGNGLNAWLQVDSFRSVGSSTALFAALGMISAYIWRYGYFSSSDWRRSVAPLFAGFALLAFTGTAGENTDVVAHFAGFLTGGVIGVAVAEVDIRWLGRNGQRLAGALALAFVGWCWSLAV